MGKNCICHKSNWDSLSCPEHVLGIQHKNVILQYDKHFGNLDQIADVLWSEMDKEIDRNGNSDLTLVLESSVRGIREIIVLNSIKWENE